MDVDNDARTIGRQLRQIRYARGKSLRMVAGLAGISKSQLSEIERRERAPLTLMQPWSMPVSWRDAPGRALPMGWGSAPPTWGSGEWIPCWKSETTRASWPSQKV